MRGFGGNSETSKCNVFKYIFSLFVHRCTFILTVILDFTCLDDIILYTIFLICIYKSRRRRYLISLPPISLEYATKKSLGWTEVKERGVAFSVPTHPPATTPWKCPPWKRVFHLTSHRSPVHNLIFRNGVIFMVDVGPCSSGFSLNDVDLHVFDLDPDKQEIDFPYDHIF